MHNKSGKKYYGPFKIKKKVSVMDYTLELLEGCKVNHTFRVSKLKSFNGQIPEESQIKICTFPKQRIIKRKDGQIRQYLVKWFDSKREDSMWEDIISLQKNASFIEN